MIVTVSVTSIAIAVMVGCLIGFSMGTVGGGGAILAVPVLVYLLGQTPAQATTASLVIVAITAIVGAVAAHRNGNALFGEGLGFGVAAVIGAVVGALVANRVSANVLMLSFAAVMVVTAFSMVNRLVRRGGQAMSANPELSAMLTLRPFRLDLSRVLRVIGIATLVGLLTGFLGVGGGFLIVPALTLVLGVDMKRAAGTSLVAMAVTSLAALATRLKGSGEEFYPDVTLVTVITGFAVLGSLVGARLARKANSRQLAIGFAGLVSVVAVYTCIRAGLALL